MAGLDRQETIADADNSCLNVRCSAIALPQLHPRDFASSQTLLLTQLICVSFRQG